MALCICICATYEDNGMKYVTRSTVHLFNMHYLKHMAATLANIAHTGIRLNGPNRPNIFACMCQI